MLTTVKTHSYCICGNTKLKQNNQLFTFLLNLNTKKKAYFEYQVK